MNPEFPFQSPQQPSQVPQQPDQSYVVPGGVPQPAPQPMYAPIPPANLPPVKRKGPKLWMILTIVFIILTLASLGVAIWAYMNYSDQKNNVDSKITEAVALAEKEQADRLEKAFEEREKEPNHLFVGPDDYGRLTFKYPKTWSVYEAEDAVEGGEYQAFLSPGVVPPIANKQQYALRVTIEERDYDDVVDGYESRVREGKLTSSAVKADEQNGTRLDGSFTDDIRGSAVIFKIRDKTVTLRSDAETFKTDFEALIKTITFNK